MFLVKALFSLQCAFLCERIPAPNEVLMHLKNGELTQQTLPAKPLKVLVWNIYKGRKLDFANTFHQISQNTDLILLQEATDGELVKPSLEQLKNFSWQMAINFFMKDNVATGVINGASAVPIFEASEQTVDLEPFVNSPKVLLITKYLMADLRELLVINIHGINWSGDDAFVRHLLLADQYLSSHTGPVIFGGDFNTKNQERMNILTEFGLRYGLSRVKWPNLKKGKQLDEVLVRGLHVREARFNYEVIGNGSDHPALELEINL